MIHVHLIGYEYRGMDRYPRHGTTKDGKVYVSLIFEDQDGFDTVKVRVPEERREDQDVRMLVKGDNVDVPVSVFQSKEYTSWTLDGSISVNVPED